MFTVQAALRQDGHGQPLPSAAQRSLERLLGRSVQEIQIVRNAAVAPVLSRARAEALTVGRTVLLSPTTDLDRPAGRALAAHELTHALRQIDPGFVPEVLRGHPVGSGHEETVALATEQAVYWHDGLAPGAAHSAGAPLAAGPAGPQPTPGQEETRRVPGLPAPWEPLPFWDPSSAAPGAGQLPANQLPARPSLDHPAGRAAAPADFFASSVLAAPLSSAPVLIQAAAIDRPQAAAPQAAQSSAQTTSAQTAVGARATPTPQVDLDQLARDVYAQLKDRLSTELRRLRS